jgi:hypothetical protein
MVLFGIKFLILSITPSQLFPVGAASVTSSCEGAKGSCHQILRLALDEGLDVFAGRVQNPLNSNGSFAQRNGKKSEEPFSAKALSCFFTYETDEAQAQVEV